MVARALAALAGALGVLLCPLPPGAAAPLVFGLLALALLLRGRLVAACALGAAALCAHEVLAQRAAGPRQDERVLVELHIDSLPQLEGEGVAFDGEARLVRRPGQPRLRLRVSWRDPPRPLPRGGETWQLAVTLRAPRDVTNPGAVDEGRILWRDHIDARAEVRSTTLNRRLAPTDSPLLSLRQRLAERILAQVHDPAAGALLAALAVGYTGAVEREQWRIYNATGITHLIAISGMHVTLFAAVAMALLKRAWAAWPALSRRIRRESFAAAGGALFATGYALLAGASVPTLRTLLMLLAGLAWRALARAGTLASALGAAGVLVVAIDPFSVLAAGFWLSFGAVGVILWREGARLRAPVGLLAGLKLQFAITLTLAPATLALFGSLSLAGLWVNPFAIPLFSLGLVPLVLGASAALMLPGLGLLATPLLWLAGLIATPSVAGLARAAATPLALWQSAPPAGWYVFGAMAVLLLVLPMAARLRLLVLAVVLAAPGAPARPAVGSARILALSAGSAPLALVLTARHALLFGTGDRFGTAGSRITSLVQPAAVALGLRGFDLVIAGTLDRDTAAGLGALQALLPARRVTAAPRRGEALPPGIDDCGSLGVWRWDEVEFELEAAARGCRLTLRTRGGTLALEPSGTAATPAHAVSIELPADGSARRQPLRPRLGVWHAP